MPISDPHCPCVLVTRDHLESIEGDTVLIDRLGRLVEVTHARGYDEAAGRAVVTPVFHIRGAAGPSTPDEVAMPVVVQPSSW